MVSFLSIHKDNNATASLGNIMYACPDGCSLSIATSITMFKVIMKTRFRRSAQRECISMMVRLVSRNSNRYLGSSIVEPLIWDSQVCLCSRRFEPRVVAALSTAF